MKKLIAKTLLLVIVLSTLLVLVGCSFKFVPNWRGKNSEIKVVINNVWGWKKLNFEISQSYYIDVYLLNGSIDENTHKYIGFLYNQENAVVEYMWTSSKLVRYKIYFYEFGSDDELKILYNGKSVKVNYNVVDYKFDKHGYETIDSIDALDKYYEVKDMILSIQRHEFNGPFVGYNASWEYDDYDSAKSGRYVAYSKDASYGVTNPNYIVVDYLSYLSDSVYYPARFDTVKENPVSSVGITISFDYDSQPSFFGYEKTTMRSFSISYSVCDPCCTAKYPLISMSFGAQSKSGLKFTGTNGKTYPTELGVWLEKYPERFFEYKHGDLTIYILCKEKDGVNAYFFDDTYFYSITSTYNQKYK